MTRVRLFLERVESLDGFHASDAFKQMRLARKARARAPYATDNPRDHQTRAKAFADMDATLSRALARLIPRAGAK